MHRAMERSNRVITTGWASETPCTVKRFANSWSGNLDVALRSAEIKGDDPLTYLIAAINAVE